MLKLKNKLFDLLARNISIESFEQWLYNDKMVLNNIEYKDLYYSIVTIDYRMKIAIYEVEQLCFAYFKEEEFLVFLIESVCNRILIYKNSLQYEEDLLNYYFDLDSIIYSQFIYYIDEIQRAKFDKGNSIDELDLFNKFVSKVLDSFKNKTLSEKIKLLKIGVDNNSYEKNIKYNLGFNASRVWLWYRSFLYYRVKK